MAEPTLFSRWKVGLIAILVQLVLLCYTYSYLIFNPGKRLIVTHYDGIKSYFSIASFLRQPQRDGMLVHGHNYPFGEYMYFTDSAPLLMAPLHALVHAIPALAPYGLYLYDLFILSSLVVSTGLLVLIFRRLALPAWLTVLLSVALPWLGPQTIRLNVGHMNLAYTPALLFLIWALQGLHEAWRTNAPLRKHFVWLFLGIVVASWLHFYYLPLLGGSLAFFVACLLIDGWRRQRPWRPLVVGTGLTLFGALLMTWGLLTALDPLSRERPVGGGGYGWIEWKFQFGALFRGYDYNKVRFPLERTAHIPYESSAYLTSFVLFGLLLVGVLLLLKRLPAAARLPRSDADSRAHFLKLLFLSSLPLALASLGETIELDNGAYVIHNYLNVFFVAHKLTERITQFRTLGRFIWPFWWAVVLGFSWYVARWRQLAGLRWGLLVLCGLLIIDTVNATHHYHKVTQSTNLLALPADTEPVRRLTGWIKSEAYQAILPLPYFHVGTEAANGQLNIIIDPDDPHSNTTYQLSMVTGLPLMSHKAARTVYHQAELLYSVLRPGGPDPELLTRLDQRPILVFLDSAYYNGSNNYYRDQLKDRPEMRALFERTPDFIREQNMRRVSHQGSWSLYEWYPKAAASSPKP
ncbi:hypothetical protein I2I05_00335 [Hymenobacter sp. BT683]|uniref:DUF6311 domain-containing protein n=1 Tax=Hymenobacter jeongseonensis TaxID=2791027 RepID=A0ABS0IBV6_9BACT|nr:hypothetical protein [Hymenobacter jeongseonensis]